MVLKSNRDKTPPNVVPAKASLAHLVLILIPHWLVQTDFVSPFHLFLVPLTYSNNKIYYTLALATLIVCAEERTSTTLAYDMGWAMLNNIGWFALTISRWLAMGVYAVVIWPAIWLASWCWHWLLAPPLAWVMHVLHVMYPVLMYCLAAVCCGLIMGGCAGFAAEALSSLTVAATWGRTRPVPAAVKEGGGKEDTRAHVSTKGKEPWRMDRETFWRQQPLDEWEWPSDDEEDNGFRRRAASVRRL